jgi:hypothetical protein
MQEDSKGKSSTRGGWQSRDVFETIPSGEECPGCLLGIEPATNTIFEENLKI